MHYLALLNRTLTQQLDPYLVQSYPTTTGTVGVYGIKYWTNEVKFAYLKLELSSSPQYPAIGTVQGGNWVITSSIGVLTLFSNSWSFSNEDGDLIATETQYTLTANGSTVTGAIPTTGRRLLIAHTDMDKQVTRHLLQTGACSCADTLIKYEVCKFGLGFVLPKLLNQYLGLLRSSAFAQFVSRILEDDVIERLTELLGKYLEKLCPSTSSCAALCTCENWCSSSCHNAVCLLEYTCCDALALLETEVKGAFSYASCILDAGADLLGCEANAVEKTICAIDACPLLPIP